MWCEVFPILQLRKGTSPTWLRGVAQLPTMALQRYGAAETHFFLTKEGSRPATSPVPALQGCCCLTRWVVTPAPSSFIHYHSVRRRDQRSPRSYRRQKCMWHWNEDKAAFFIWQWAFQRCKYGYSRCCKCCTQWLILVRLLYRAAFETEPSLSSFSTVHKDSLKHCQVIELLHSELLARLQWTVHS